MFLTIEVHCLSFGLIGVSNTAGEFTGVLISTISISSSSGIIKSGGRTKFLSFPIS